MSGCMGSYVEANSDGPLTAESAHILMYSILLLNTALHNPSIAKSRQHPLISAKDFSSMASCEARLPRQLFASRRVSDAETPGLRVLRFAQTQNAGVDLSEEELTAVYKDVSANEIRTHRSASEEVGTTSSTREQVLSRDWL